MRRPTAVNCADDQRKSSDETTTNAKRGRGAVLVVGRDVMVVCDGPRSVTTDGMKYDVDTPCL